MNLQRVFSDYQLQELWLSRGKVHFGQEARILYYTILEQNVFLPSFDHDEDFLAKCE